MESNEQVVQTRKAGLAEPRIFIQIVQQGVLSAKTAASGPSLSGGSGGDWCRIHLKKFIMFRSKVCGIYRREDMLHGNSWEW